MAKSWHNQNQPYEYSQVYNNTTLVRTVTNDSTDVKYIHSYGATRKTGANTDPREVYCVFDKGSYYLNVYHQLLGTNDYSFEEDGGAINQTDINSYRINGDNVSIYESYTVSSNYASPTSVTSKQGQTNTPLQISHNTTEAIRGGIITVQQVYRGIHYTDTPSNALQCAEVEFTQRGKYSYRINIVRDSGYSDTIDHDGTTKYTCYLQRKREGSSWANVPSSTSHEIEAAWSCLSSNIDRDGGATVTGSVDSNNHYAYHITVTGCNTRFGTYSGTTLSTQNVTITVNYNGNIIYSGSPNSVASNYQIVAVRGVPPYYDYRTFISPTTGTICCDTSRGSYSSTLTFTATFQQCTSTGFSDNASSTYGWTSWETVTTSSLDFTWTTTNTTATSVLDGVLSITAEYEKYHKSDTTTTVNAVINSGVTNNQGVAWNSSKVLSPPINASRKDHNNTYYCTHVTTGNINIFGRADLYEYRVVFIDPVETIYIYDDPSKGNTHQCDAKLQERKNLGRTDEDGYEWTDIDSTRSHFNWSIPTSNGSLTVNTTGLVTGTNKNYYVGKSTATPGYTNGTSQTTACQDKVRATYNQSINRTDSLHNCAAVISFSPKYANTTYYIRTMGYMTVYKFSVTISTPTTARIVCANSGRTGGYSTSHTFTANLVYQYRVGTTTNYTWSTEAVLTSTGSNFTWTSDPSATNYYTLSNGTCSNPHTRFNVADTTFTITATAKSSAYDSYNIESGSTYSNTCTLIVLGRADKYQYQVVIVSNTSVQYIYDDPNKGNTYQCNAKLQQQKNESGTWTDFDTNNSHFNWSTVSNNGSISVNSSGLATGTNKNYYVGKNTDTPGYGDCKDTVKATYNQSITKPDNLHNCNAIIVISPNNANTAEIRVKGYITYYCFYVSPNTLTSNPNPAKICCDNSRTDLSGYGQSCQFTATIKYKYRVGTTTSWSWSSENILYTGSSSTYFTWTGTNSTYYTSDGKGKYTSNYDTYDNSRSDHNFTITATMKSIADYNIDNSCSNYNTTATCTLTVLAREDIFTCGPVTLDGVSTTINDGGTASVRLSSFKYYKNGTAYDAPSGSYTVTWNSWPDAPGTVSLIISSSSSTICNAIGTNRYYVNNSSLTNGYYYGYIEAVLNYSQSYTFTGKFGRVYHLNCNDANAKKDILIRGHDVIYDYRNFRATSPTAETIIEYNGSVGLTNSYDKYVSIGTVDDSPTNYIFETTVTGFYARTVSGMTSNFSRSGSTITTSSSWRNNYSSTGYADLYLSISWNDPNGNSHTHNFPRIRAKPAPDKYELSWHIDIPSVMDDNTSSNYNLYVDLIKNGNQQISRWISIDFTFWADDDSYDTGLYSWDYNPPLNIHLISVDLDYDDSDKYFDWEYSISAGWGPYNDRNSDIYGEHSGNVIKSDSGTTRVKAPPPPSWRFWCDIYLYMKDETGTNDLSRWRVTDVSIEIDDTSHSLPSKSGAGWNTNHAGEVNFWGSPYGAPTIEYLPYYDTPDYNYNIEVSWEWEDNNNNTHYESHSESVSASWDMDGGDVDVYIHSWDPLRLDIMP